MSSLLSTAENNFYSLSGVKSDGSTVSAAADLEGKVVYATNVASLWGETRRGYALFESLGKKYSAEELAILAFPSREYADEEFGTDEEIASFAASMNFPPNGILMKLGSVKGDTASDLWKFLRDATGDSDPRWNFSAKYLVSKSGKVSIPRDVESEIEALVKE